MSINNKGFKKFSMYFPFGIFFAFFDTNNNIYNLNNVIYFAPWPLGWNIEHLEVQQLYGAFSDEVYLPLLNL